MEPENICAAILFYKLNKGKSLKQLDLVEIVFAIFIILFVLGFFTIFIPVIIVNLLVFLIGLSIIKLGANQNHLGILNFGLFTITALIICRYFDTNLSFVFRGILFVIVGAGFFGANYWMLRKRKKIVQS